MQGVVSEKDIEEAKKLTETFSKLPEDGKNQVIGYMACLVNTENANKEKARI
jgi:hypothetical protein